MVMELSGRLSWICLLFGLAAGFPYRTFDKSVSMPSRSGVSSGGAGSRFFSTGGGAGSRFSSAGSSSGIFSAGGGSGSGVFSGSNTGSGASSAGYAALQVFQQLLSLAESLQGARQMGLGQAWNNNNQVAFGSVAKRPLYPASRVIHYNSGYQRARDGRTDQKYVTDTFGHIPETHPGQKGVIGSKGQQVQRG